MSADKNAVWKLKSGHDRRFRQGHPWVYSNELTESPRGVEPGSLVELRDATGKFLARGYGNPHSLIAFRAVSRDPSEEQPLSDDGLARRIGSAIRLRASLGLGPYSARWVFGEADGIPGLVIDRYRVQQGQVLVIQAHTAGIDALLPRIETILERVTRELGAEVAGDWACTAIVVRNDLSVRKLEGIVLEEPRVLRVVAGLDASALKRIEIQVRPVGAAFGAAAAGDFVPFAVDLLEGQKTGFFLDQAGNIELAAARLTGLRPAAGRSRLRIIDLCCYVGQWSTQLGRYFRSCGVEVETLLVDASADALALAKANAEMSGVRCETLKADVLGGLSELEGGSFDLVICDPPALIKGRKDMPQGKHAYLQLNTQAFRLVRQEGAIVSCSCSALLEEEELLQTLSKAAFRNRRVVRWVGRGAPAPDHPMRAEFPEGRYLKAWVGFTN